jgi:hypothetical protein
MIVEVTSAQARCHDNATAKYKSDQPTLGLWRGFASIKPLDEELWEELYSCSFVPVYESEFLYLDFHGNRKYIIFYYENGV